MYDSKKESKYFNHRRSRVLKPHLKLELLDYTNNYTATDSKLNMTKRRHQRKLHSMAPFPQSRLQCFELFITPSSSLLFLPHLQPQLQDFRLQSLWIFILARQPCFKFPTRLPTGFLYIFYFIQIIEPLECRKRWRPEQMPPITQAKADNVRIPHIQSHDTSFLSLPSDDCIYWSVASCDS